MVLKKEILISDNDVYVMAKTKDFLVINSNYDGISMYDNNLNYVKTLKFTKEVIIDQIYTSILNNKVVIIDYENSLLYIVDLNGSNSIIAERKIDKVFNCYFESNDYNFELSDSKYIYTFSYIDGNLLEKQINYNKENFLSMCENKKIYVKDNKVIYYTGSEEKQIFSNYMGNEWFSLYNNQIIKYNEQNIFLYNINDNLILKDSISVKDSLSIRKVYFDKCNIIVLINSKESVNFSMIREYAI